jgi:YcxB-like protein
MSSDGKSVNVFVKYRFGDLYRATVLTMVRQFRVFLTILVVMTSIAGLTLLLAASRSSLPTDTRQSVESIQVLFPRLLGGVILFLFGVPLLSTRKILNRPEMKQGFSYVFSGIGLQVDSMVGHSELKWLTFHKAQETKWAFLLFGTAGTTYTFPKHCFGANSDFAELRRILRTALPKSNLRDS